MKKRVACYCRVSTDSKEQENSLIHQEGYFSDRIAEKEEYTLFKVYSDKGTSGTKLEREGFNKMLYDAGLDCIEVQNADNDTRKRYKKYVWVTSTRMPKFDYIWVKNTSRFARNVLAMDIIRELASKRVYIDFLDVGKSTENEADMLVIQLFQTFDETESRDKSRKVKIGLEQSAKRGRIAASAPYGYRYITESNSLEIIQNEAETVQMMFELCKEGLGARRIRKILTQEGRFTRDGKKFCEASIKRILQNERYYGLSIRNRYDHGGVFDRHSAVKTKDEEKWIVVEADEKTIPPIISKQLFSECAEKLKARIRGKRGINTGKTKYAQLLKCDACGKYYISQQRRNKHTYICGTKKVDGMEYCHNPNVLADDVEIAIAETTYYKDMEKNKDKHIRQLNFVIRFLHNELNADNDKKVAEYKAKLADVEAERQRYIRLFGKNIISEEQLESEIAPLDREIEALKSNIELYSKDNNNILGDIKAIEQTIAEIQNYNYKESYTEKEILSDIEYIRVARNGKLIPCYKTEHKLKELADKHGELRRVIRWDIIEQESWEELGIEFDKDWESKIKPKNRRRQQNSV